jgi:hypothetical protein
MEPDQPRERFLVQCKQASANVEVKDPAASRGVAAELLRSADQRLIKGEQMLSRLAWLIEDRRAWGLETAHAEALLRRDEATLASWLNERDSLFRHMG